MNIFKAFVLFSFLVTISSPVVTTASDETTEKGLPKGFKLGLEYWQKSTDKDMKGSYHATPGVPPLLYYEDGGELNGPVWTLTGEYRFHPQWSVEASYGLGSGNGNAYWDSPVGGSYEDVGTFDDEFRKWHFNLFYTPLQWQANNGNMSHVDVGLGYQQLSLEYSTANWSGGGAGTWSAYHKDTIDGIQLGLRGNVALTKRFYLKGQIFWLPNFKFEEKEYETTPGANPPGTWFGTGSGNGWDCSLSINFEFIKHWGFELGYRYLVFPIDDWNTDPSNTADYIHDSIDLSNEGPFVKINYSFDFSK